ncbi:MAG TPA: hypothetical protein VFC99_17085 [Acidimicrobiia bacterium]|nr:hypothetical protein [Acidimicrobiia bacterium]
MPAGGPFQPSARLVAFASRAYGGAADAALAAVLAALPGLPLADRQDPERLAAAMLVFGQGDAARLQRGISIAKRDWRDLLVAAGLAQGDWPEILERTLGPRDP